MLWLALHLPRLALEVFQRGQPGDTARQHPAPPVAVTVPAPGLRVVLADAAAVRQGVRPGMTLAAAHALVPDLVARARDPDLELCALESLALWAGQFTPAISLAPPDALLLEIGGCLRLFDGLDALLARARQGIGSLGFDAVLACAPTPSGALMLARNGLEAHAADLVTLQHWLGQLPVEAAEAPAHTLAALRALGMRTISECLRLPRDGFARRFGPELLDQLDRALGLRPDPRVPHVPPARFSSRLVLPVPVPGVEQVLFGARRLATELAGFLAGRDAGVTRFTLRLEHEDHPPTPVLVELSMPSRDPAHLALLLRERLGRITLPGPVEAFSLRCSETMQLAPRNFSLFPDRDEAAGHRVELVERLRARLGRDAVHGLALVPEHRPELAFREAEPGTASAPPPGTPRPLWLLQPPRPVARAGLRLLAGPERIESGWWEGNDIRRDYYVAAVDDGARVWAYREAGADGAAEHWFLHGLFA
ncbi:MAG: DNA polymerase Y family protein [Betaproteobacteria bacterium]|jgi:protein ImuB